MNFKIGQLVKVSEHVHSNDSKKYLGNIGFIEKLVKYKRQSLPDCEYYVTLKFKDGSSANLGVWIDEITLIDSKLARKLYG
jgi:hypothetical protein